MVLTRLHSYAHSINPIVHYVDPAFGTHHFEECPCAFGNVVEILSSVFPFTLVLQAIFLGFNVLQYRRVLNTTLIELTFELIYTHDRENE